MDSRVASRGGRALERWEGGARCLQSGGRTEGTVLQEQGLGACRA